MSDPDCPLCRRLAAPLGPDALVWEFRHSVALLGDWQAYRGYCVLVSRQCAGELIDLPPDILTAYFAEMATLAGAIREAFRPRKLNYECLGNQVPHPHWHVFPRFDGDPNRLQAPWLDIATDPERMRGDTALRSDTVVRIRHALTKATR